MSGFAAQFFDQADGFDDHAAIHRLAHIVDGEQGDAGGGEGFHLDAGAADSFGHRLAFNRIGRFVDAEVDSDFGQCDRMAERNQVGGSLRGHDAGEAGNAKHITFLGGAIANHRQRVGLHDDAAGGDGNAPGLGFIADADHQGAALFIKMSEIFHGVGGCGW